MKLTMAMKNGVGLVPIENPHSPKKITFWRLQRLEIVEKVLKAQSSMLNTFHIMSFPYNAFVGAHPFLTAFIIVLPFSIISHLSLMSVGDHQLNSFLGYLFDGEEENSLTSHVEEIRALRFCKKKRGRQRRTCWEIMDKC
jgi:hypothetical protein